MPAETTVAAALQHWAPRMFANNRTL